MCQVAVTGAIDESSAETLPFSSSFLYVHRNTHRAVPVRSYNRSVKEDLDPEIGKELIQHHFYAFGLDNLYDLSEVKRDFFSKDSTYLEHTSVPTWLKRSPSNRPQPVPNLRPD